MPMRATVTVDPKVVLGPVHDRLYGANLEHVGQSVHGGTWSELLKDRKFAGVDRMYLGLSEGLSHEHPAFGVVAPWEPVGPDRDAVLFVHDNTTFYTGSQSQRITVLVDDGRPHGIRQGGIHLRAGDGYQVRLVVRGQGQAVQVSLGDVTWIIPRVEDRWDVFERTMSPARTDARGALSITVTGSGSLWVGCASLMPADNLEGHRRELVEAMEAWRPTSLRWPGGNFVSAYHWRSGTGDRDLRPSYVDPVWHLLETNDVGTDEFIRLCRLIGTEPELTVNMGSGTVEEAAAWVEYCNGVEGTPGGELRARNGHAEPFEVTTWYVGNEQFGNWQVGHVDAETYAQRYLAFARAMREVDPRLRLIAVGAPAELYGRWNELVLRAAAAEMDELSVHYYSIRTEKMEAPPTAAELCLPKIAAAHEVEAMLDATIDVVARHASPPVPIAFDEWNTYVGAKGPDFIEPYDVADALYAGSLIHACLRRSRFVTAAAVFNLVNVMGSYMVGPLHAWEWHPSRGEYWVPRTDGDVSPPSVWKTPTTLVLELLTGRRGDRVVETRVDGPTFASPARGNLPAYDAVPTIDAATTLAPDGGTLYLSVVNRDLETPAHVTVDGVDGRADARTWCVTGRSALDRNSEEHPRAVTIEEGVWPAAATTLDLPPHSFTMVEIPLPIASERRRE